jgi:hypothetical protein
MFQPVLPLSGYTGWRFLERTLESQQAAFSESAQITRATDYFAENIGKIETAEDLVNDRRLLEVALGAFGLDEDINNKFFIKTILEEGTLDSNSLANKLSDTRYQEFSSAFGFGDFSVPRTVLSTFPDEIISAYQTGQFEQAVGAQDDTMRLALNVNGALGTILDGTASADTNWYNVMGNPPLRQVFETALGLPSSFAQIDIDQQLEVFRERSESIFGTSEIDGFAGPEIQEKLIRLFMIRSEAADAAATSSGSIALTLLRNGR